MKKSELKLWLFGELRQVLADFSGVSISTTQEASDHVDVADATVDHPKPALLVQGISTNPQSAGIGGGHLYVDEKRYNDTGLLNEIEYRRDSQLRVSIVAVVDNDPQLADDLETAVADHFGLLSRTDGFPEDVTPLQIGESTPQDRQADRIQSSGTPLVVEYERYLVDSDPDVAEEVNVDVDVSGGSAGSIDDTDTDADAYNETF